MGMGGRDWEDWSGGGGTWLDMWGLCVDCGGMACW